MTKADVRLLRAAGFVAIQAGVGWYFFTDLIKHHPHTIDVAAMLLGDPEPSWVEGRLVQPDAENPAGW